MSFTEYRARGNKNDPKVRLDQLLRTRAQYGWTVPNMEGYEQFGSAIGSKQLRTLLRNPYKSGDFRSFRLNDYKKTYVKTKKYDPKTETYRLWDSRTNKYYTRTDAYNYINEKNDEAARAYYLKVYGTETPQKDIEYLTKLVNVEDASKEDFLTLNKMYAEKYGSKMLEGTDMTVAEKKDELRINKLNEKLKEKKEGTSFERDEIKAKKANFDMKAYKKQGKEFLDLFIQKPNNINNLKINQSEATRDLSLTNGTR